MVYGDFLKSEYQQYKGWPGFNTASRLIFNDSISAYLRNIFESAKRLFRTESLKGFK
jgi:hypothetical protein